MEPTLPSKAFLISNFKSQIQNRSRRPSFPISNFKFQISNCPVLLAASLILLAGVPACTPKKTEAPQQRSDAAKALFERASKSFHIPSAEAADPEKERLQNQASDAYADLVKRYPE